MYFKFCRNEACSKFWGLDMSAAYPGFVVDAQMIALLYESGSSRPLRNILCVIGYPELLTAVHHQP